MLAAMPDARLRQVAPDVLVQTSDMYMTNTTVVVSGSWCLVIDPGLLPSDLRALESSLVALGVTVEAAVATHPHWDHVLWSSSLGEAPRFASPRAIAALTPWSGPAARLVAHDEHAPGHSAVHLAELGIVVAGDMLSDVEVPGIDWEQPDALAAYRHGLDILAGLDGLRLVIPGHGRPGDGDAFRSRLAADRRFLDALAARELVRDPRLEGWPPQRQQHQANVDGLQRQTTS